MRYTTLIDITEFPTIYRNQNCRLLYLHMVLRSGWHDTDRDMLQISIRRLAMEVGVSVAAVRHALAQLQTSGLIARTGEVYSVKKWIIQEPVTPRPKTKREAKALDAAVERRIAQEQRERESEIERIRREKQFESGKTDFMLWYEDLLVRSKAGDLDAARSVKRHASVYEQHKAQLEAQKKSK